MRYQFSLAALALAANASPIQQRDNCTSGQVYCNGPSQWAVCGPSGLQWSPVAAGTVCSNGQIVAGGAAGSAPSAAASTPVAPAASVAAAPSAAAPSDAATAAATTPAAAAASAPSPSANAPPAAGSVSAAPSAAPSGAASDATSTGGSSKPAESAYKMFSGDGSTGAGWPAMSDWVTFDAMWDANKALMSKSCDQFKQPNNSDQEISDIQAAITKVAGSSGVDPRFVLAIIMQESKGCVRVWSTTYSTTNPGLMQSANGKSSCNTGTSAGGGNVQTPCPSSEIEGMVTDGTTGTGAISGVSLKDLGGTGTDSKNYYVASRKYNSGSVAPDGDLSSKATIATKCYSSDVANRLLGWASLTGGGCTLDGGA